MKAVEVLALIGSHVTKEVLLRNEYLAAENEILRSKIKGRLKLTDEERVRLAKIGQRLGKKALAEVGAIFKPETVLAWIRKLVAASTECARSECILGALGFVGKDRVPFQAGAVRGGRTPSCGSGICQPLSR